MHLNWKGLLGGDLTGVLPNPTVVYDAAGIAIAQQVFGKKYIRPFDPQAGANITITPNALSVIIASTGGSGTPDTADNIIAAGAFLQHSPRIRQSRAGSGITITEDALGYVIAATGSSTPDSADSIIASSTFAKKTAIPVGLSGGDLEGTYPNPGVREENLIDGIRAYLPRETNKLYSGDIEGIYPNLGVKEENLVLGIGTYLPHSQRIPKVQAGTNITIVENAQGPVVSASGSSTPDDASAIIASIAFDKHDIHQPVHQAAEPVFAGLTLRDQEMNWQVTAPAQITASQNDYNPGNGVFFRINADTSGWDITGMAGGVNGRVVVLRNFGAATINFLHQSTSSAAANRFALSGAANQTLGRDFMMLFIYDATSLRWNGMKLVGEHSILSSGHNDALDAAVSEGSIILGNSTPAWSELVIGANGKFLKSNGTTASWEDPSSGPPTITAITKDLGAARRSGTFDITGLSGLTADKTVIVQQLQTAITSKGNARDEFEMDPITLAGYVFDSTTIRVQWACAGGQNVAVGDYNFGYLVGA